MRYIMMPWLSTDLPSCDYKCWHLSVRSLGLLPNFDCIPLKSFRLDLISFYDLQSKNFTMAAILTLLIPLASSNGRIWRRKVFSWAFTLVGERRTNLLQHHGRRGEQRHWWPLPSHDVLLLKPGIMFFVIHVNVDDVISRRCRTLLPGLSFTWFLPQSLLVLVLLLCALPVH